MTPVEPRPPGIAVAHEYRNENDRLDGHPQGGADPEDEHLTGAQCPIRCRRGTCNCDEQHEGADRNHVVRNGREHRKPEMAAGVEHLREHRVEAVEEDLRQA